MSHYLLSYYVFFWFIWYFFWNCILYLLYCIHALYVLSYIILYYILCYIYIYIYMYVYAHTEWRMHVWISPSRPPTHQGWIARPCAQASVILPICNAQRTHCQLPLSWGGISSSFVLHPFPKLPVTKTQKSGADVKPPKLINFWHFCWSHKPFLPSRFRQVFHQAGLFPLPKASVMWHPSGPQMPLGPWRWAKWIKFEFGSLDFRGFKRHHVLLIVFQLIQFVLHVWLNAFHLRGTNPKFGWTVHPLT